MSLRFVCTLLGLALSAIVVAKQSEPPQPTLKTEHFDNDPQWEGVNNRPKPNKTRKIRQDFGFRPATAPNTQNAIGGYITPSSTPAYYAKPLPLRTLNQPLTASGTLLVPNGKAHLLLGFFNSKTLNEWRTPNSIALRIQGRGNVFFAYVEYCTQKWRAGADSPGGFATIKDDITGRSHLKGFPCGDTAYPWTLRYDPDANGGNGSITVTLGGETAQCYLTPGHKMDGATFDHFGLLNIMKSADSGGEAWLPNISVEGKAEDLSKNPQWEGLGNRTEYPTTDVRPQGDFGYSPTAFAGGNRGELGGLIFRGDCRYPNKMACYGDRLSPLTLDKPLLVSGKVSLRRGVSDSTTLIGFYHSKESMATNDSQKYALPNCFLGIAIEGPSRDGFYFYPAYRIDESVTESTPYRIAPRILPDGTTHNWSLTYTPTAEGGEVVLTFDGKSVTLKTPQSVTQSKATFDRFGIITTWIDGNGQRVYYDDLTYTVRQ